MFQTWDRISLCRRLTRLRRPWGVWPFPWLSLYLVFSGNQLIRWYKRLFTGAFLSNQPVCCYINLSKTFCQGVFVRIAFFSAPCRTESAAGSGRNGSGEAGAQAPASGEKQEYTVQALSRLRRPGAFLPWLSLHPVFPRNKLGSLAQAPVKGRVFLCPRRKKRSNPFTFPCRACYHETFMQKEKKGSCNR